MRRRIVSLLCVFALCMALVPASHAAGEVCFTAVNERILPLTADTMPIWSGGVLYVPYSVFSADTNNGPLVPGSYSVYSRSSGFVSFYVLRQMLVFDLNAGTCYNQNTGEQYSNHAIIRNGTAYVPAARVCSFFGLNSPSYFSTEYGYMVRITNSKVILTNNSLIDAGGEQMRTLLRDYNQSLIPAQKDPVASQPSVTPDPSASEPEDPMAVTTYLAFRCETAQAGQSIADTLERNGNTAVFFFPAEKIGSQGALIRRLLGSGHSVGILAEGNSLSQTRELLASGGRALEAVAHTRTYLALVPEEQRQQLEGEGWVCWNSSADAVPDGSLTPYNHAVSTVRALSKKSDAHLTLDDSQNSADAMTYLLRQLKDQNYVVTHPRETRL